MIGMGMRNNDIFKPADAEIVQVARYRAYFGVFAAVDKDVASACVYKLTVTLTHINKMHGSFSVGNIAVHATAESCTFVKLIPGRNEVKVTYRLVKTYYRRKNNRNYTYNRYYGFLISPSS